MSTTSVILTPSGIFTPAELPSSIDPTSSNGTILGSDETSSSASNFKGYDHIHWYVSNARQAASYYVTRFGFREIAYRGLETGSRYLMSTVVAAGAGRMVFTSPLRRPFGPSEEGLSLTDDEFKERAFLAEVHKHLTIHGDAVRDIAFEVDDVRAVYAKAMEKGGVSVMEPTVVRGQGKEGDVLMATVRTFGDTTHTLLERSGFTGCFLPGFRGVEGEDQLQAFLPKVELEYIDHLVGNQPIDGLQDAIEYYEEVFDFHRFWSVDDKNMCSDFSAMNSIVVASLNEIIKMPLNEPAPGLKKSQIQEFIDFNSTAGVQHIAFHTTSIIDTVTALRARGVHFLSVPSTYYDTMRTRLAGSKTRLVEDLNALQNLNILIDFDEGGYLLQIFTKHVTAAPTVFLEIIQRNNFGGFGVGNFKSLFEAFEREQEARGTL